MELITSSSEDVVICVNVLDQILLSLWLLKDIDILELLVQMTSSLNQTRYLQSINQLINHSINQSINQSMKQSVNQSIIRLIDQPISQTINQSINQLSQSINLKIIEVKLLTRSKCVLMFLHFLSETKEYLTLLYQP